jgi:hypothetical protein
MRWYHCRLGIVAKQQKLPPDWQAKHSFEEAQQGNPFPLIARVRRALHRRGEPLSENEIAFVVDALEATIGKRARAELKRVKEALIAMQVDDQVADGKPLKNAIKDVAAKRGCAERTVNTARANFKKRQRELEALRERQGKMAARKKRDTR